MTAEEIDKIFEAIKNNNYSYLLEKAGMESTYSEEDLRDKQIKNIIFLNIFLKIQNGDYEYFISKMQSENKKDIFICLSLLSVSPHNEKVKDYIDQSEQLELTSNQLRILIENIDDPEYTKKCIERRKELGLGSANVEMLIESVCDSEFVLKCMEQRKEMGLDDEDISALVEFIFDQDVAVKCIEQRDKIGLKNEDVTNLIYTLDDPKCVLDCIERRKELKLGSSDIATLIVNLNNPGYSLHCVEHRKKLELEGGGLARVIESVNDANYIKQCIAQKDQLGLCGVGLLRLIECLDTTNESNSLMEEFLKDRMEKYRRKVELPSDMTIGIEIECIGSCENTEYISMHRIYPQWKCEGDKSIEGDNLSEEYGLEIQSPILTGENDDTTRQIKTVCAKLETIGQYANETCGGHIHIGADYLTNTQAWQNLLELWGNNEKLLYIIGNEKGTIPRSNVLLFAEPISRKLEDELGSDTIELENEEDLDSFKEKILKFQGTRLYERYKCINFQNLSKGGKGTIEFRIPNGTVNADTWIENINLFGGLVKAAQYLSTIQEKSPEERTEEERRILKKFDIIKSDEIEETEKLEALLEIVIPEHDRHIYRERYEENVRLLEEEKLLKTELAKETARGSIILKKRKEDIGSECFTGDRITGTEIGMTSTIIEDAMKHKANEREEN